MNPSIGWVAISPELFVVTTLAIILLTDLLLPEKFKQVLIPLSLLGVVGALTSVIALANANHFSVFAANTFEVDSFALLAKGVLLAVTLAVLLLGSAGSWKGEYITVVLSALLGMLIVVSARDLLLFVVAFELLAIPGYMLVGWNKRSSLSHEGTMKYFVLGVISTAVMLYGISLIYGLAGSTAFTNVASALSGGAQDVALARIAVVMVFVGMVFKVAAVPFHFWTPDAYQAAPIPVAAFLSVATKAVSFFALFLVAYRVVPNSDDVWGPLLWVLAALTMTVGNLAALRQKDLVRLLAYSSIAQAGYALVPLAVVAYGANSERALHVTFDFLIIYAISNIGAFACLWAMAMVTGSTAVESLHLWARRSSLVAVAFSLAALSLAGIPPLGGWFAKLVIFEIGVDAGSTEAIVLVVIAALNSALGLVYYANILRGLWLYRGPNQADTQSVTMSGATITPNVMTVIGAAGVLVVVSGLLPGLVVDLGGFAFLAK